MEFLGTQSITRVLEMKVMQTVPGTIRVSIKTMDGWYYVLAHGVNDDDILLTVEESLIEAKHDENV